MSKNGEQQEKVKIKFHHTGSEYYFEGFNPNYPNRVAIRSLDGNILGSVDTHCCEPVGMTWDELRKKQTSKLISVDIK